MVTEYFFNFSCLFVWKNEKNKFSNQEKYFSKQNNFFSNLIFPIFPGATLQKNNEISNKSNLLGLRKDRKKLENVLYQLHNKILGNFIIKNVLGVSTGQQFSKARFSLPIHVYLAEQFFFHLKSLTLNDAGRGVKVSLWVFHWLPFLTVSCYGHKKFRLYPFTGTFPITRFSYTAQ